MRFTLPLLSNNETGFILIDDLYDYLNQSGVKCTQKDISFFLQYHLWPSFSFQDKKYVIRSDVDRIIPALVMYGYRKIKDLVSSITEVKTTEFYLYPLLKNSLSMIDVGQVSLELREQVDARFEAYFEREKIMAATNKSYFTRSAYYMGSKKSLSSFIMESISDNLVDGPRFVDLMTGSGTMAGVFSLFGETIASDAMVFPRLLALVQGGGHSKNQASKMLDKLKISYSRNYAHLKSVFNDEFYNEEKYLYAETNDVNIEGYSSYITTALINNEKLEEMIQLRKDSNNEFPYMLVSSYFANVYFGFNQSIQIDSIRYAIDQIDNKEDAQRALGALISSCSKLATNHAGHFAQPIPIVKDGKTIRPNVEKMLIKRTHSVWREFEATLISLSDESPQQVVDIVDGPWENALQSIYLLEPKKNTIVYVDAPYTREEYSRYYHVLETIAKYNYPNTVGHGKIPSKALGERFNSEFFTRDKNKVNQTLIRIIGSVLDKNWVCAWSYSNKGLASIVQVVDAVIKQKNCKIRSYSTPYSYKNQRRKDGASISKKDVTEYLIVFEPK